MDIRNAFDKLLFNRLSSTHWRIACQLVMKTQNFNTITPTCSATIQRPSISDIGSRVELKCSNYINLAEYHHQHCHPLSTTQGATLCPINFIVYQNWIISSTSLETVSSMLMIWSWRLFHYYYINENHHHGSRITLPKVKTDYQNLSIVSTRLNMSYKPYQPWRRKGTGCH